MKSLIGGFTLLLSVGPCSLFGQNHWEEINLDSLMQTLTLNRQIAQLLMPPVYAKPGKVGWEEAEEWAETYGIGGVICMQGGPELQKQRIARLQARTTVPLWVSTDAEWGLGMRLDSTRSWPRAMTFGAANDSVLTREIGQEIGRALKSVGVHVNFAPVVDVNSNPNNPVIGNRSFGENTALVSRLGSAWGLGLQDEGILATAKHFPGHGDTDADSHLTLPSILHDRKRLDSLELKPFRAMIEAGIGAMMAAHLNIPALDATPGQPSTLSPAIVDSLLRQELGFTGIVFTDAMTMKGFEDFAQTSSPHADALLAGNDVLLFPASPEVVIHEIQQAIAENRLDSVLIASKCRRVLEAKKRWSLKSTDATEPSEDRAEKLHRELVEKALTVVVNENRCLPISTQDQNIQVAHIQMEEDVDWFTANLQRILGAASEVKATFVPKTQLATTGRDWLNQMEAHPPDWVLLNLRGLNSKAHQGYGLETSTIGWLEMVAATFAGTSTKVAVLIHGNPYSLNRLKRLGVLVDALVVGYQDDRITSEALAAAVAGSGPALGRLPVHAGVYPAGTGKPMLGRNRLGFSPYNWSGSQAVDSIVKLAMEDRAMPGCRIVIAHKGQVIHNASYGSLTFGGLEVTEETVYDLASITKVFASTLSLMWLEDRGLLERTDSIGEHLPELEGTELGQRTVEDILSHTAGLTPWIPFYLEAMEMPGAFVKMQDSSHSVQVADDIWISDAYRDTVWQQIAKEPLRPPGREKYSDLGFYAMKKIIERLTNQPLEAFVDEQFYGPLGLASMGYLPLMKMPRSRIAPTEDDQDFRKQLLQGHVHDPGAAMLGGVGGHAGLFANAMDCARLMQMLLNGGIYGRTHMFRMETVKAWTARVHEEPGLRKGCGWDKPADEPGVGSCCDLAGWGSFGHSGFTGTLVWADPDAELIYVFLSNRVHPDPENWKLIQQNTRTEIQRVIYESLGIESRFAHSGNS